MLGRSIDVSRSEERDSFATCRNMLGAAACETDSYIVIYNPPTGNPEIYKQAVLPFGSIPSVTAFLRCALGIWHVGSSLLKLAWTSYFDDFLSMTPACLDKHTELCVSTLFQLLGLEALHRQTCAIRSMLQGSGRGSRPLQESVRPD